MTARLAQNKMFVVLGVAVLALLAVSAVTAALSSNGTSPLPGLNSSAGVKGFVNWEIHDRDGNLVSGGHSNEIAVAGLDNALKFVVGNAVGGAPAAYNQIAVLQDDTACVLADYDTDCIIAADGDIDGVRVRAATSDDAPAAGSGAFTGYRVITVESTAFVAEVDNVDIDAIVLTSSSADSKPALSTVFAFNDNGAAGWNIPTAGSTITFRWTVGIQEAP